MTEEKYSLFKLLNEIEEKTESLRKSLKISKENSIIAFRGESKDYGNTKLLPSLYRKGLSIKQEIKLFQLLSDYDITTKEEKTNLQKAIASQHYLSTSRLLDITFNVLIAIYFGTNHEEYREDKDGYLYIFCLPQHFSPSSIYIEKYYDNMLLENSRELVLNKNFKVITHGYFNERIKLQRGGFIFFSASNITQIPRCFYEKIKINYDCKKLIRSQLSEFFSIYESSVFPEKDKKSDIVFEGIYKENQNYSNDESIKFELNMYFENLRYEINSYICHIQYEGVPKFNSIIRKKIMRRLRKYKQDMEYSFKRLIYEDEEKLLQYKKIINHDFKNIRAYAEKELKNVYNK